MELVKNIFFNTDKIIEGSKIKISYVGYLFQNDSKEVFLHYGFGLNWDNVSEAKMEKTELGFQCEIDVLDGESLNLCFRNESGVWDNCFGQNFIFPIEKKEVEEEVSLVVVPETGIEIHKGLRKTYMWSKKLKIAVYKIIKYIPKIISGNYKRKIDEN
ncbi:MAG: hypothetical protein GX682_05480 [Clostridiaceae bacterium]|nr:hypothetical protein [Clostridiaceae bacterium]